MYYGRIKHNDIANGEGVRTSLFVSGCRLHCKHCFNKETWRFDYGDPFTEITERSIIESLKPSYISGLTILGGEAMEEENQEDLRPFLEKIKAYYPNKTIWLYTGYRLDESLKVGGIKYTQHTTTLLEMIDVLVDGPFESTLKDIKLSFRGSSNQRLIDMNGTRHNNGKIVLYDPKH